jgi:periplasmic protein TonB
VVIRRVEPQYPSEARRQRITGQVVVKCLVNTDGRVVDAAVVKADPAGAFDLHAVEAVRKWYFKPARLNGSAVSSWVLLSIHFKLTP